MKKVYTLKDVEDIIKNGGNFDSLPPRAILTPSARDKMNDYKRAQGKSVASITTSKPSRLGNIAGAANKLPIHDPIIPDYEYSWTPGSDPKTPAQIAKFFNSPEIVAIKERIVDMGKRMWSREYTDGNGGNITVRVGDNLALCTPTLISKGFMTVEDICLVDLDANQLAGKRARTSEAKTHFAIMKRQPNAKSCVHAHPVYATAFAVVKIEPPTCLIPEVEVFAGKIALAPYRTPGSPEMADIVGELGIKHQSVLMANHGVICWGKDVEDAYWKMENTEAYCKTVFVAHNLGKIDDGYGADNLRELIKIRKSLGMDDYRENLSNKEICDNSTFIRGACPYGSEPVTNVSTPTEAQKNPDAEQLIALITDQIMQQVKENDGLPS